MLKRCAEHGLASYGVDLSSYVGLAGLPLRGARAGRQLGSMAEAIANALLRLGLIKWLRLTRSPWRYNCSHPWACTAYQ